MLSENGELLQERIVVHLGADVSHLCRHQSKRSAGDLIEFVQHLVERSSCIVLLDSSNLKGCGGQIGWNQGLLQSRHATGLRRGFPASVHEY